MASPICTKRNPCLLMTDQLLIVFVKNPQLGKVKTRLAKTIGDNKALAIYNLLLQKTKDIVAPLPFDVQIYYSEFVDRADLWPSERFKKAIQIKGNLGEKMTNAFENAFKIGYKNVCIIGSDCYDLDTPILQKAFKTLQQQDFVIGPSFDGGYYLLGMNALDTKLFQNKQWSTSSVFNDTMLDFNKSGKTYSCLVKLSDIDVEADLDEWAHDILNR